MMGHEVLTVAWEMVRTPLFTEHFLRCQTFLSLAETGHTHTQDCSGAHVSKAV